MDRAGGEAGDHFTAGTVENRGSGDTDKRLAVLLVEALVDVEPAFRGDPAMVRGGDLRILRQELDGEDDFPKERIFLGRG